MKLHLASLFLAGTVLFSCSKTPEEIVLAHVGKEKIIVADLQRAFEDRSNDFGSDLLADPQGSLAVKKKLIQGLVEERLLVQVADEKKVSLSSEEKEAVHQQLASGYSDSELERMLAQKKISLDQWQRNQEKKKIIEKLINQELGAKTQPSPEEVGDYYKKNQRDFRDPDQVRCRHIVASKEEKAKTILTLLKQGENFAVVAQKYSESPDREQGGDLGYIARGSYPSPFDDACFTLNTGQTSEVVPSEYGYHIFRVVEKKPGRQLSLQESSPKIEAWLKEEKKRKVLGDWLENLYHSRNIVLEEETIRAVPLIRMSQGSPSSETQNLKE